MKVLWLCNVILSEFCEEFGIKRTVVGGWMSGMLSQLDHNGEIETALCFPVIDENRMKDGIYNDHKYYSFQCDLYSFAYNSYDSKMVERFLRILEEFEPDVIHIWGTEYPHSSALVEACREKGLLARIVVSIQGLVSVYADHFLKDIPMEYCNLKVERHETLEDSRRQFEVKGKLEQELLKRVVHVTGRTDWDRACVKEINGQVNYHFCNEILRDIFYEEKGTWDMETCRKHSIFVSQALYPVKGMHYLLQALPWVLKTYQDVHLYVAGNNIFEVPNPGPYAIYLKKLAEKYRLSERITFLGELSAKEMCEWYKMANVFVLPSTIENSPNSLCEAMMIGTPVISSFTGGVGNLVAHGETGYLYQYDAPYMLAYYINEVFGNIEKTVKISTEASDFIIHVNDREENVKRILEIYSKISI